VDWIEIVGAGLGAGLGALVAGLLVKPWKKYRLISVVSLFVGIAAGSLISKTYIVPLAHVWDAKRLIRATPFYKELSVYDPETYRKIESILVENTQSGGTPQKAGRKIAIELAAVLPKYVPKASDESVVTFLGNLVPVLQELDRTNPDACYSFLFPDKFGEAGMAAKFLPSQFGNKNLQALEGIILSSVKNPQPAPDEKKAKELLQPIISNLVGKYGSDDLRLIAGTARDASERKKVCEIDAELYRQILSLPPADASTIVRYLLSTKP
jgi:hypothetical protein